MRFDLMDRETCVNGHPWKAETTALRSDHRGRVCLICKREQRQAQRASKTPDERVRLRAVAVQRLKEVRAAKRLGISAQEYRRSIGTETDLASKQDEKANSPWNSLKPKGDARDALADLNLALESGRTNCFKRPAEFADFDDPRFPDEWVAGNPRPIPSLAERKILCEDCFAFDLCRNYGRVAKPDFGIFGSDMYVGGKIYEED